MLNNIRDLVNKLIFKNEDLVMITVAVTIGVTVGCANIIFRELIIFVQLLSFGTESEVILYNLQTTPVWKILLIPTLGGLIVGIISRIFKSSAGRSVPDVIKAVSLNKVIPSLTPVIKIITSSITLGTGGSAGREGPIVVIGAGVGSSVARLFKFSSTRVATSAAAGAAGGIAATFNAPLGGAMFAAEVLVGEFSLKTFTSIIISAVTATAVSRSYFGDELTIHAPNYSLNSFFELPLYALMGIFIAIISVIFIRFYYRVSENFQMLKIPSFIKPAIGGLLMGIVALYSRNIMGVGYGTILEVLNGEIIGYTLFLLIFLKIIATSLTLGSGGSGGQFVPTLFIGAMTGGFFGYIAHMFFPEIAGTSGTYALVGMGAMLAAVIRAPITSIFIIFEITQNYQIILPLMISVIIANLISYRIEKDSIFTWVLSREGFNLGKGVEQNILSMIYVKDIMMTDIIVFEESTPLSEIRESIVRKPHAYFPVVDKNGCLSGMISLNDLKNIIFKKGDNDKITAGEIGIRNNIITVREDESLLESLADFGIKDVGDLPVVEDSEHGLKLIGLLRRSDIIIAYNKMLVDYVPNN